MRAKAAAVAMLEPEQEANSADAITVDDARLPGTRPTNTRALVNKPLVRPARAAMKPISRNIGTALRFQFATKFDGVGEIAIVRQRDVPMAHARENRLRVFDCRGAGRAVARMSDRHGPLEIHHLRFFEALGDEAHRATDPRPADFVNRDDAG